MKYVFFAYNCKDSYDVYTHGDNSFLMYESMWVWTNASNILFSHHCYDNVNNIYYSYNCTFWTNNCFWCSGLKNKSYCILNKQYTKEQYEKLVSKIIEYMQKTWEWWEFFPSSISPFWYNETVANEYFPLKKEDVIFCHSELDSESFGKENLDFKKDPEINSGWQLLNSGWQLLHWNIFNRSDYEAPFPKVEKIIKANMLPDNIKEIPDYASLRVDENIPHTLYDDYTYKRPAGFEIYGKRYIAKDWKEVFVYTCEVLAQVDRDKFQNFLLDKSMQGRKIQYFCKDASLIRAPRKIKGTDIFVMTNMSANQIRNVIERMLRKYNLKVNDYKLFLKADYTDRHE